MQRLCIALELRAHSSISLSHCNLKRLSHFMDFFSAVVFAFFFVLPISFPFKIASVVLMALAIASEPHRAQQFKLPCASTSASFILFRCFLKIVENQVQKKAAPNGTLKNPRCRFHYENRIDANFCFGFVRFVISSIQLIQ